MNTSMSEVLVEQKPSEEYVSVPKSELLKLGIERKNLIEYLENRCVRHGIINHIAVNLTKQSWAITNTKIWD